MRAPNEPRRRDHRNESFIGAVWVIGSKPSARATSSTTPVKCLESSARLIVFTPVAGSWTTALLRPIDFSTTK